MAGEEGPAELGVAHINKHGEAEFGGCLHCSFSPTKGRLLRATRAWKEGELILAEKPLHIVQEESSSAAFKLLKKLCKDNADDFDYEPLWYWCAIQSLTAKDVQGAKVTGIKPAEPEVQRNLLLLHHEEVDEPSDAATTLVRMIVPNADAIIVERLIQVWVLNCFEYSERPQGYSTYFYSSFMSHSCFPNAVWHYTGTDHVLRCRRDIAVGDEVCITYLPESGLLQSAPNRRMELNETKRFWCMCERCAPGLDDLSRGMVCPKAECKQKGEQGVVYAKTPVAGPAQDGSLLAAHFIGAKCTTCDEAITKPEATRLAALEKKLQEMVEKMQEDPDAATIKKLEADEKWVLQHFQQHVLQDLMWEQMSYAYRSKKRYPDQHRMLYRRTNFHKDAYPGLNGAHAWALEALGDCDRDLSAAKNQSFDKSKACYAEALDILRKMFGEDHEYVTDVEGKEAELDIEAERR